MEVSRVGIVLYVKKYFECISFYKNVLSLNIMFQKEELTCFDLYGTYLMVEKEDRESYLDLEDPPRNFSCIRINANNVKAITKIIKDKKIDIDYKEHDWGIVAKFHDPDGNLIAFKDNEKFDQQITG